MGVLIYLFFGMLIVIGAVFLLGIPTYLALNAAGLTHWSWMTIAGALSGALLYICWQGWPGKDFGPFDLELLSLFFVAPGGLLAAAFWYGTQR